MYVLGRYLGTWYIIIAIYTSELGSNMWLGNLSCVLAKFSESETSINIICNECSVFQFLSLTSQQHVPKMKQVVLLYMNFEYI